MVCHHVKTPISPILILLRARTALPNKRGSRTFAHGRAISAATQPRHIDAGGVVQREDAIDFDDYLAA